jgi:hypothetical protein
VEGEQLGVVPVLLEFLLLEAVVEALAVQFLLDV